jgi:negative regulator of flagellin synthesis FlgM
MKIEGRKPPDSPEILLRTQKVGHTQPIAPAENSQNLKQADQVHLSEKAKELSRLKQLIEQMPEIRTEKVEALKQAIAEGRYQIDPLALAGKILEEQ